MAISAIITQPAANSLKACMRPILFDVQTTLSAPMVFCDVYINSVYYGTYEHTVYNEKINDILIWQFDIRDKVQEYFKSLPQQNGGSTIKQSGTSIRVFCKFRDSVYSNTIVVPQTPIPVQSNSTSPASPGGGTASNTFYVMYATHQHETNENFETHLSAYKRGSWVGDAFPLTQRPINGYNVIPGTSDYFPFAMKIERVFAKIRLHYRRKTAVLWQTMDYVIPPPPPVCFGVVTGVSIAVNNIARTAAVSVTMTNATDLVWSIPEYMLGNPQGPVSGGSFTVPALPIGDYTITIWPRCANGVNGTPVTRQYSITARPTAWRGRASDAYCETVSGDNTGRIIYQTLEQIYTDNNSLTGNTKPNVVSDADYVAPAYNYTACPVPPPSGSGRSIETKYAINSGDICGSLEQTVYISPIYTAIAAGITVYSDSGLTTPLTGFNFILGGLGGEVFSIDSTTGIVGLSTGLTC